MSRQRNAQKKSATSSDAEEDGNKFITYIDKKFREMNETIKTKLNILPDIKDSIGFISAEYEDLKNVIRVLGHNSKSTNGEC